ncbi:MAG: hypothetical protein A2W34_04350 [Chloroflexi bacterium RBG_16_64_32]|nr:MAG: hypothetical protein A2W34_04350 [Chloroflexi bacterium RBG_16_64_32]
MQRREGQDVSRVLWPAALVGVCGGIIVSFLFVALGVLHPALALPLIGLGIAGALARAVLVRDPGGPRRPTFGGNSPPAAANAPIDTAGST